MNRTPTPGGVFVGHFVCVRWVIAIRLQCFGNPLAAVGDRFIAPAYTYSPTKWQTKMCVWWCGNAYSIMWKHVFGNVDMRVRWNGNTYLMTWIYVFDYVRIRARWIGPYAWRSVRNQFRGWALVFHGMFVGILWSVLPLTGVSHNYQSPFPTQVHKPTVYHFLFCCHFYHSSSAFNHLCIS